METSVVMSQHTTILGQLPVDEKKITMHHSCQKMLNTQQKTLTQTSFLISSRRDQGSVIPPLPSPSEQKKEHFLMKYTLLVTLAFMNIIFLS